LTLGSRAARAPASLLFFFVLIHVLVFIVVIIELFLDDLTRLGAPRG
jgi:hypothetical protein